MLEPEWQITYSKTALYKTVFNIVSRQSRHLLVVGVTCGKDDLEVIISLGEQIDGYEFPDLDSRCAKLIRASLSDPKCHHYILMGVVGFIRYYEGERSVRILRRIGS
jgi:hypothetical protein